MEQLGRVKGQELPALAQSLEQLTQTYEQKKRNTNDRIAAQLYRWRGALAFVHDTQTALHNYQRATELDPHNLEGWNQLGLLQFRVGKLDAAAASYKKVEILATEPTHHATIYGNLGILYHTQDNLEQAKIFYRKALAINKALGHKECIAGNYATLGIIYQNRGDLEQAKNFYRKALAINEALGRKESMAGDYANLGIICHIRDDLEQAEDFYRKALAINEALGSKENMIGDYGNLGNIYYTRGKLEQAEAFYRKALAISEKLGNKQLIASIYFNLGNLYQTRGNLEQAREYWRKALALFEQIGMPHQAQKVRDLLK